MGEGWCWVDFEECRVDRVGFLGVFDELVGVVCGRDDGMGFIYLNGDDWMVSIWS